MSSAVAGTLPVSLQHQSSDRATALRAELKQWEKDFAAANAGRKAGKGDIKANAHIAARYKEYEKLKSKPAESSAKGSRDAVIEDQSAVTTPSKKRKRRPNTVNTPRKHTVLESPHKSGHSPQENGNVTGTPSITRTVVGPTPQKDGRVLGLFDLLPEKDTPAKAIKVPREALGTVSGNTSQHVTAADSESTPRKRQLDPQSTAPRGTTPSATPTKRAHSRTPQSVGRRYLLATFAGTPLKQRRSDSGIACTPTKADAAADFGFSTPAFLRRDSQPLVPLPEIAEDDDNDSGDGLDVSAHLGAGEARNKSATTWQRPRFGMARVPGLRKSLSSMIAEIRKNEEDRMDEEIDILREMEQEKAGGGVPEKRRGQEVLVEDSQALDMLGPDGASDSEDDGKEGEEVPARRVWKKKGQKRQTRRVISKIKPCVCTSVMLTITVRPRAPVKRDDPSQGPVLRGEDAQQNEKDAAAVAETQPVGNEEDDSHISKDDRDEDFTQPKSKPNPKASSSKEATSSTKQKEPVKKAARKISATAHANFRKLKIRSKGASKGKKFGRFGKR